MQNLDLQSDSTVSGYKLFSAGQIMAGTFFGSIFAGGYMLAENYTILGEVKKSNRRLLRSVLFYLLYVISAMVLKDLPDALFMWVGIIFIFIYKSEFKGEQEVEYSEHLALGGKRQSNWFVAAICALNLIASFLIAIITAYVLELMSFFE